MDLFKKRTVNFSAKEVGILMSLVLKFKSTIECKKTDKTNNDMKQKAWEQLSNEFNSICGEPFRDAKSLRCKYENQKKRSKHKFADEKVWLRGTGGGPGKPTKCDEIDEKMKDIIGTQMTGFHSEFGGDCIQDNMQMENVCKANFDSEVMEEDAETSDEEDCSFSANTNILETSCSTALPTDWTKMTPDKLRTPKSKPLKTILKKACGKVSCQEEGYLDILPRSKTVSKAIGENLALTCKPVVRDPKLISQVEWLDPKNRRIEAVKKDHIYVQNFPGEPGLMLVFPAIRAENAGVYTCVAKYANSLELNSNVTVETYEDIRFVDAPENQYPVINKDYKIKCEVRGNPSPTVDWYKNEVNIITHERYITVDGGLIIKNVRASDDGVYKCTAVVSTTGQIKSKEIKVEVLIIPKVSTIREISVVEGESAYIKCNASGKPPPTYTWIKESTSQDLAKTDRFSVKDISGELSISRVEFNDQSTYICVAENQAGRDEGMVELKVLVKPNIYELINVTAPIRTETKIICKAHGRPPPNISFHKLSNKVPFTFGQQQTDKRITLEQQIITEKGESIGTLIVNNLNRSDDGLYRCIAENKAGKAYKNGHITVEFPPTFERTKNFPHAWTWANNPGNITCIPEAIPNATIKWMYGGIEIKESSNFRIEGTSPKSNLIVFPHNERRYYTKYECVATNKLGSKSLPLELREAFRPELIQQIRPNSITATTIKFSIVPPPQYDGLPLRTITVQYKPDRELTWDYARNYTWSFGAPYILEDLMPEVTYQFRFAARNDVGMGPWTNAETISMPRRSEPAEPKILLPPHSIIVENISNRQDLVAASPYADRYDFRWGVPNSNGDPITHYIVRYCMTEKVNGDWRDSDCSKEIDISVQYTHYELKNLLADTTYKIELWAHNAIGSSSPAQIRVKTARGIDPVLPVDSPAISSGAIIGIVLASILLVLLVVDIACFCVNRTGILATLCYRASSKHDDEDPKLGRDEREPLKVESQANGERQMSVEYEGGKVYSKPGTIIGKHSAV